MEPELRDNAEPLAETPVKNRAFSKPQSIFFYVLSIILSIFVSVILTLLLLPFMLGVSPVDLYSGKALSESGNKTVIRPGQDTTAVTAVANKLKPSVVNIRVKKTSAGLFQPQESEGEGSGVIFKKDGYILTNNHVIEGAKEISVKIGGSQAIKATVIGADSEIDIAVIKVNRNGLEAAEIERNKPQVGELAVAIGSPLGFEQTVTSGIVSAVNRVFDVPGEDLSNKTFTDLIQTDTAINPGNSGGALANAEGKVIGINTLIASQSGGSEGIGFAIPISRAVDAAEQLMKTGKVSHPYIGILGRDLEKDFAETHNLPMRTGAVIEEVSPGSPASRAGIRPKDIIVQFDNSKVGGMEDLITFVRRGTVGDKVKISYYRGASRKTTTLVLGDKPSR